MSKLKIKEDARGTCAAAEASINWEFAAGEYELHEVPAPIVSQLVATGIGEIVEDKVGEKSKAPKEG